MDLDASAAPLVKVSTPSRRVQTARKSTGPRLQASGSRQIARKSAPSRPSKETLEISSDEEVQLSADEGAERAKRHKVDQVDDASWILGIDTELLDEPGVPEREVKLEVRLDGRGRQKHVTIIEELSNAASINTPSLTRPSNLFLRVHDGDVAYFSVSCVGATRSRNLTLSRTDLRIALFAFTPSTRILLHFSVEQFTALPLEPTKAMETLALETPTARSPQVDDEAKQLEPQDLDQGDEQISKTTDDMQEDVIRQSGAISPSSGEEDDVPKARKSTASKPSIEPADVTIISDSDDEPAAAEVMVDVKGKGKAKEEAPRSVMQAAHDSIYEPRRKPLFAPSTPLEPLLPRLKGKGQASLPKPRGKVKRKPTRLVSMASAMQTIDESDYDSEEERNRIRAVDVRLMRTRMRDEWSGMDAGELNVQMLWNEAVMERANKSGVYAKALYRAMATKRFRQIGQGEHARQCYIRLGFTLVGARLHKLEDVVAAVQDYDEAWRRFTAA